jgi:hypothetical protein
MVLTLYSHLSLQLAVVVEVVVHLPKTALMVVLVVVLQLVQVVLQEQQEVHHHRVKATTVDQVHHQPHQITVQVAVAVQERLVAQELL